MFKTILFLYLFYTITWAFELTIVHTNDIHGRLEPFTSKGKACKNNTTRCYGGVVRRGSYVEQVRARGSNVLLLDAGDHFQDDTYYYSPKVAATSFFLNKLNYTAMALGNHEFNDVWEDGEWKLKTYLPNVTVPMLCANLITPQHIKDKVKEHIVVDFNGTKVGIIGYVTREVTILSRTGFSFEDEEKAISEVAQKLTLEGIKIIIAVGHSGLKKDIEMATNISEIDVFVGGHSYSFLYNGTPPTKEYVVGSYPIEVQRADSKALVVQAGAYGKYVGTIIVTFDDTGKVSSWSGNPVLMDSSIPDDEDMKQKLETFINEYEEIYPYLERVVGSSAMNFDNENHICRVKECEMGNLFADAMMDYVNTSDDLNADLALFNSGLIRGSLAEGNVTYGDIDRVFPFWGSNDIVIVSLLGSHLKQVFEHSVKDFFLELKHGKFLQVSKEVFVIYDYFEPNGDKVRAVLVYNETTQKNEEVSDDKWYRIVVPRFLVKGGDGYEVLKENAKDLVRIDYDCNIFVDYLKKYSPIKAELRNRIVTTEIPSLMDEEDKEAQSTQLRKNSPSQAELRNRIVTTELPSLKDEEDKEAQSTQLRKNSPSQAELEEEIITTLPLPLKDEEDKKAQLTQPVKSKKNSCGFHFTLLTIIASVFATLFA